MTYPMAELVTVVRRTASGRDRDGNDTFTTASTQYRAVVWPRSGWPRAGAELTQGDETVTARLQVLLPTGTVVGPLDRVDVRGLAYEVDGQPVDHSSPFTANTSGLLVSLRRVTG